jgi:hypothetical protein
MATQSFRVSIRDFTDGARSCECSVLESALWKAALSRDSDVRLLQTKINIMTNVIFLCGTLSCESDTGRNQPVDKEGQIYWRWNNVSHFTRFG